MSPELTTADVAAAARERNAAQNAERPPAQHDEQRSVAMYSDELLRIFARWDQTQAAFVDELLCTAVERADALVADACRRSRGRVRPDPRTVGRTVEAGRQGVDRGSASGADAISLVLHAVARHLRHRPSSFERRSVGRGPRHKTDRALLTRHRMVAC